MPKPRNKLLDWCVYAALRYVTTVLHAWPVGVNLAVARWAGGLMYRFDKKHRDRARANLRRSFPEKSDAEIDRLAVESMRQLFMLGIEVMFTTRLVKRQTIARVCVLRNFEPTLRLLLARQNGLILLTGHYGNWEILGYVLATLGFKTVSVARPLDNPYINRWLLGVRERQGQKIIAKKGAVEDVTHTLDAGGVVGFIADQNAGPKGLFVDFFGRKASTYKSIGLLAMRYQVPVIIGYARRVPGVAFRFEIAAQDIIHPSDWSDQPDPLRYLTQRYTSALEQIIRDEPGQYLWVHRRWKSRPKGEAPEAYD